MTNRLHKLLRSLPVLAGGGLLFFLPIGLHAQAEKFNFNYPGPTTASAGPTCSRTLASIVTPLPTVTSTVGATITMSMQDPAETTGGYGFNASVPAPATLLVGWLVKDNQGNSAHFYFTINIVDQTPPVFDLTNHPNSLGFGSVVQVPATITPPVTDNCTTPASQVTVTYVQSTPPDTCAAGTFTRTWTATDLAGNTTTFTQIINISADVSPPTFSVPPQSGSAPCAQLAAAYPAWLATQMANFEVDDVSGIRSVTNGGPAIFPPGCAMTLTVTFVATDNCSLALTRTATFSTSDTNSPIVLVEAKDTVGYCSPTNGHLVAINKWIRQHGYQQSIDSCSPPSAMNYYMRIAGMPRDSAQVVAAFLASFSGNCTTQTIGNQTYDRVKGKVTVDFLVRDVCGNESYAGAATFAAIDTLPPVVVGVDKAVACGGSGNQAMLNTWINAHGNATATDNCSGATWTNFFFTTSNAQTGTGAFNTGPYPTVVANDCGWYTDVIFRSADQCGNVGDDTLRFRTNDGTAPVISGFTPIVKLYCPATAPTNPTATVTDNCDLSPTVVRSAPTTTLLSCSGNYNVQLVWTATDDCGNTATALQTFQVRDTTGPVFTLVPAPKTFRCDTFVLPPAAVKGVDIDVDDECSVSQQNITTQVVSMQNLDPAVCGHYSYEIKRIFTATDDCGNTSTATQILTIVDNLGPIPAGTLDTTVVCEITPAVSLPTATDICSGPTTPPVFLNQTTTPGSCADNYLITLRWRVQDVCANTTLFTQTIHVRDTMPPTLTAVPADISVECDAIPAPPPISNFTADDNCDQTVSIILTETETRDTSPSSCDRWTNYTLHRTWTATDNCGNTTARTQNIHVEDHRAPVLILPGTLQLTNDVGDCGVALTIPAPLSVFDLCTSLPGNITLRDTAALISTSGGPIATTPVDTVVFQWVAPNLPPNNPVVGPATLTVSLNRADAEIASESFSILGEGNQLLGTTLPTPSQCGSSTTTITITANQLNTWLADGLLILRLAPNGVGGNAANAICAGGRARATLNYQAAAPQVPVTLTYRLDNMPTQNYPPVSPQFIGSGSHTILYTASDCAGNSSTAVLSLNVRDTEPPTVFAPAAVTAYVGQNNCQATVTLPFPTIADNCNVSGRLTRTSAVLNVAFQDDPNAGDIPKITTMTIMGLVPNAVGSGKLTIRHKGDNAQNGEFFEIYNGSNPLAETTLGEDAGQCSQFNESIFEIAAASINAAACMNGSISFKAQPNNNVLAYNDFISPCAPLLANGTDGVSQIQAVLEYNYARVNYEIIKGGVTIRSDTLRCNLTTVTLPPGAYTVKYRVTDNSGIEGMTTYALTVRDTVKPKAFCLSKTIFTSPSGSVAYTLLPSEINNNSVDNCAGTNLSFALSQTTFTCNQAPNSFPVTLTVTDTAGNSATCTALVKVETIVLHPTYPPVCEGGDLFLFADSTLAPNTNLYTFMWTGPNNYFSNQQSPPKISTASTSDEGTYSVKITGLTGCTATGSVTVDLLNLPTQPLLNITAGPYCQGSNVVLSTPSYSGQNVNYLWYEGNQANSVLLATTLASSYTIVQPTANQQHQYFVIVAGNGCTSSNSDIRSIIVFNKPMASVEQAAIVVCEGQPITLGTTIMGNNLQYIWTGPGGYMSNQQYPPVTASATLANAGQYSLVISRNNCLSDPAFVVVSVKVKPVQPQIVATNPQVCEGRTVILVSGNYTGTTKYVWTSPQLDTIVTNVNNLTLPNLLVGDSGNWRLTVEAQGCMSTPSLPFPVRVQAYPDVTAPATVKLCTNDILQISPTANTADSLLWAWTGPGNFQSYDKKLMRDPGVAGQYKVVGKTTFGCADSAFVNVLLAPPPVINAVTNNAPTCVSCNSNATLQATILGQYGPLTYQWTGPGGIFISALPTATIPSICPEKNGNYNLIVRDSLGCESLQKSTLVKVQKIPNKPIISPTAVSACLEDSVTLQVMNANDYTGTVRYIWSSQLSGLDDTTTQSKLVVGPLNSQNAGNYTVRILVDSCQSPPSDNILVTVKMKPQSPKATALDSFLCEGETLQLFAIPASGSGTYSWRRTPLPFTATTTDPSIPSVMLNDAGLYSVRITTSGCASDYSEPLSVQVSPRPVKPFLKPMDPICLGDPNAKLKLSVLPGTSGAKYQFFNAEQGTPLGDPVTGLTFQTADLSGLHPGINRFYAVAILDSCFSVRSDEQTLRVDTKPNITAYAGEDFTACISRPLLLNAADPGEGTWTQLDGPNTTILNPNNDSTLVTGVAADTVYHYKWTLSNGACKNYSSDTVQVTAVALEEAMAVPSLNACEDTLRLSAKQGITTTGTWTQLPNQGNPILGNIVIVESTNPNTLVRNLQPGQAYAFFWTLGDTGCGAIPVETEVRSLSNKPNIGADQSVCSSNRCASIVPITKLPALEQGKWSSKDTTLVFDTPKSTQFKESTSVCNLKTGPNEIYWTLNNGFCEDSRDTLIITFGQFPIANPDQVVVASGTLVSINVLENDVLPDNFNVQIITPPAFGNFDTVGEGQYRYQPSSDFVGTDQFMYKICNTACTEDACSIATVQLSVQEASECLLPTLITPNGDDVNDLLFFPCIARRGEEEVTSELTVFNQWGNEVFHAQPYENNWKGTSSGEDLPPGTYYYILEATYLEKPVSRFIIIQR